MVDLEEVADVLYALTAETAAACSLRQCSTAHLRSHEEADDRFSWRRAARSFARLEQQAEEHARALSIHGSSSEAFEDEEGEEEQPSEEEEPFRLDEVNTVAGRRPSPELYETPTESRSRSRSPTAGTPWGLRDWRVHVGAREPQGLACGGARRPPACAGAVGA